MAKLDRRSFLARVGAPIGLGALGTIIGSSPARAQRRPPAADQDSGPQADRVGCADPEESATGFTDSDGGTYMDPANRGRGPRRTEASGVTDSDEGAAADAPDFGRNGH